MKVSVCMITYNHEKFIAQAIESVLMQETNFDYELVIGEDCSTDRTREVVLEYQRRYPEKIRLLLPERNLGMMKNFIQTLQASRGEYTALVEGDDFWTDPAKLQKQVDALDRHPDCAMCFHRVLRQPEGGTRPASHQPGKRYKRISTVDDVVTGHQMCTCSVVFRTGVQGELPDWMLTLSAGDFPLFVLTALKGDVFYLNETMATYRVHGSGAWSGRSAHFVETESVRTLEQVRTCLPQRQAKLIDSQIHAFKARLCLREGDLSGARRHAAKKLAAHLLDRNTLASLMILCTPKIYRALRMPDAIQGA